jgi:hypothetical protein
MQFPLKLEVASCQTWDAGEKHRGTKVEAVLVGDMEHVEITRLIFRGKSIIPMIKNIKGRLFLTANFEYGTEKISEELVVDNKIDMVIYTHKGKVYELPLKDIQRKSMKYYHKQ